MTVVQGEGYRGLGVVAPTPQLLVEGDHALEFGRPTPPGPRAEPPGPRWEENFINSHSL